MTPKERWLAVLSGRQPDRMPMDYWGTAEATAKVVAHLGVADEEEMFRNLHIDRVITVGPTYAGPPLPADTDEYGCRFASVDYGTGNYRECIFHPLAAYDSIEEIEAGYTWPSIDLFDFSQLSHQVSGLQDYPVRGGGSEPFLVYKNLRGQEQAFIDLIENEELVDHCLDHLFGLARDKSIRVYESLPDQVNISYVAEDMGAQEGLMLSLAHIRRFLLPGMKQMIDLAHEVGAYAFFHSDGAIREILPEMIDLGIDVLNPVQWRCRGMARQELKRDFGDRIVFHGGVDNQQTLPFGRVVDVEREVRENLEILGAGGGYILAPCHNIQAVSPAENVVALYRAGYELG